MRILLAVATAAALTVVMAPAATPAASVTKVNGTVGPGFTIGLTQGGKKATKLKAGKVTFVVSDKASIHNFALDGPKGFEKKLTDVSFKGTKTITLTLKPGTYKFYCEPHESSM